jgi:hypothetical protein
MELRLCLVTAVTHNYYYQWKWQCCMSTGNLDGGKWLEAVLDIFLAVINLFGGLWMLFLLYTWGTSFQQSIMDGTASGFRRERLLKGWYSISSLLKWSEHTVVWSFTY